MYSIIITIIILTIINYYYGILLIECYQIDFTGTASQATICAFLSYDIRHTTRLEYSRHIVLITIIIVIAIAITIYRGIRMKKATSINNKMMMMIIIIYSRSIYHV